MSSHNDEKDNNNDDDCGEMEWKQVHVDLIDSTNNRGVEDWNHYDESDDDDDGENHGEDEFNNKKKKKKKRKTRTNNNNNAELEAEPHEGMGIFLGLQVLDGNQYSIWSQQKQKQSKRPASQKASNDVEKKTTEIKTKPKEENKSKKTQTKKKKNKKQNTPLASKQPAAGDKQPPKKDQDKEEEQDQDDELLKRVETNWQQMTGSLHPTLYRALRRREFYHATPIQQRALAPAMLGRCNIVGAAPTGSGKTLAYLLPILQRILTLEDEEETTGKGEGNKDQGKDKHLMALILAPTRELALQITRECHEMVKSKSLAMTLVGGLSMEKQRRILQQHRPHIVVATPGRLWDMISTGEDEHLNDLSRLQFLVLDEADRMVQQGSFPQLQHILNAVHEANPLDSASDEEDEEDDDYEDEDRLQGLLGVPGEARVVTLQQVLKKQQLLQGGNYTDDDTNDDDEDDSHGEPETSSVSLPPVHRQTFIYSATLTLPALDVNVKRKRQTLGVEGALAQILQAAHVAGKTKVIDLTKTKQNPAAAQSHQRKQESSLQLPQGLALQWIACTQRHKDSFLYAYLVTTTQGISGPCLIFCNSIAAVKRVGKTLETLRLPVKVLHAKMAQKARLKAIESLRQRTSRSIVVATDVAARGLDIPSVATVVHYDVARSVDTFVHRAGRTARGVGKHAIGASMSLIAPHEDKAHEAIVKALGKKSCFESIALNSRLLQEAQERVNLASKWVARSGETRAQSQERWLEKAAREADLELDDDEQQEEGGNGKRERARLKGALNTLLSKPMTVQRFGSFLSTRREVSMPREQDIVTAPTRGKKRRRRR